MLRCCFSAVLRSRLRFFLVPVVISRFNKCRNLKPNVTEQLCSTSEHKKVKENVKFCAEFICLALLPSNSRESIINEQYALRNGVSFYHYLLKLPMQARHTRMYMFMKISEYMRAG